MILTKEAHEKRLDNLTYCVSKLTAKTAKQLLYGFKCDCKDIKDLQILTSLQELLSCYTFERGPGENTCSITMGIGTDSTGTFSVYIDGVEIYSQILDMGADDPMQVAADAINAENKAGLTAHKKSDTEIYVFITGARTYEIKLRFDDGVVIIESTNEFPCTDCDDCGDYVSNKKELCLKDDDILHIWKYLNKKCNYIIDNC